ncbi:MAG: TetR/AcrR family transcriptional regulator [Aliishimia sp.]
MVTKTETRRARLRETLIDVAELKISATGLHSLKARELAKEAGCALGAIYTHFNDMQALIMAVNGRTFRRLGTAITGALQSQRPEDPNERLVVMSNAYLAFAAENTSLWRALFDLEMSSEGQVPAWYLQELGAVFALIAEPLSLIYPDKSRAELDLTVRALFSAVHGIVLLGLEKRISAVPLTQIEAMIAEFLHAIRP